MKKYLIFLGLILFPFVCNASSFEAQTYDAGNNRITNVADPSDNQDVATKNYVASVVNGVELSLFFKSTTVDDVSTTYRVLDTSSQTSGATLTSDTFAAGSNQLYRTFMTLAGYPHLPQLNNGWYSVHLHSWKTGNKSVAVYCKLHKADAVGVINDVPVFTTEAITISDSSGAYDLHAWVPDDVSMNVTDRLALQCYANVGTTGTNVTINTRVGGTENSHLSLKVDSEELKSVFVPYTGAERNVNLGSYNITASDGSFSTMFGQAYTGTDKVVRDTSPTLANPTFTNAFLGTPASGVATNLTGTASGLTAGTVTTNANLTGPITSVGNATTLNLGAYDASPQTIWGASFTGSGTASSRIVRDTSPTLYGATLSGVTQTGAIDASGGIRSAGDVSANSFHVNSGGVYFPLSGANPLDDYEEGTWTPVYQGAGGSIGATAYTTQVGTYTKIGNRILLEGKVVLSNNGDWTGAVSIGGLPFTPTINAAGSVFSTQTTYDGHIFASIGAGSASIGMTVQKSATAFADLDCGNVTDTGYFTFSAVYY